MRCFSSSIFFSLLPKSQREIYEEKPVRYNENVRNYGEKQPKTIYTNHSNQWFLIDLMDGDTWIYTCLHLHLVHTLAGLCTKNGTKCMVRGFMVNQSMSIWPKTKLISDFRRSEKSCTIRRKWTCIQQKFDKLAKIFPFSYIRFSCLFGPDYVLHKAKSSFDTSTPSISSCMGGGGEGERENRIGKEASFQINRLNN